jgi:hypothetical protein
MIGTPWRNIFSCRNYNTFLSFLELGPLFASFFRSLLSAFEMPH